MKRRELLTIKEINTLIDLLKKDFQHKKELRKESYLAKKIKFSPIPSSLSESLTIHLLRKNFLVELEGLILTLVVG